MTHGRLSPGDTFGLVALITDISYAASVTALTPLTVYRLAKEGIADAMKAHPELATGLEALARRGQEILDRELASQEDVSIKTPEAFLSKLRQFVRQLRT